MVFFSIFFSFIFRAVCVGTTGFCGKLLGHISHVVDASAVIRRRCYVYKYIHILTTKIFPKENRIIRSHLRLSCLTHFRIRGGGE